MNVSTQDSEAGGLLQATLREVQPEGPAHGCH